MSKFTDCLAVVLEHEGGYCNDEGDAGGPTNFGIAMNEDTAALTQLFGHAPTAQDMKDLTEAQAGVIYANNYWNPLSLDSIVDAHSCLVIFDMGVLCGIGNAARRAQTIVSADADGDLGPISIAAINGFDSAAFVKQFLDSCAEHFQSIADNNSNDQRFLKGWLNRVDDLRARCST